MITFGIIIFVVAALMFLFGAMQLKEKGPLLNNSYIYANKEQRRTMDKKPYYRQSGIVFLMLGVVFIMMGIFCMTKNYIFLVLEAVVLMGVAVYAIASSIAISNKKKLG